MIFLGLVHRETWMIFNLNTYANKLKISVKLRCDITGEISWHVLIKISLQSNVYINLSR